MPHDATSSALQSLIEDGLNAEPVDGPGPLPFPRARTGGGDGEESSPWVPGVGRVNVTTDGIVDNVGGRCWDVTFSSAVGVVGPLTVSAPLSSSSSTMTSTADGSSRGGNRLTGLGAAVSVETLQAGNTISGSFSIKFTGDGGGGDHATTHETAQLPTTASAAAVSEALLELPGVAFARTTRSVPAEAVSAAGCSDGLCRVGPTPGGGLEWIVELGTRVGNAEPSSPTVAVGTWAEAGGTGGEGVFGWPEVDGGQLAGEGAAVSLRKGWAGAAQQLAASFNASQPFSIALGGAGASHGELSFSSFIVSSSLSPRWLDQLCFFVFVANCRVFLLVVDVYYLLQERLCQRRQAWYLRLFCGKCPCRTHDLHPEYLNTGGLGWKRRKAVGFN